MRARAIGLLVLGLVGCAGAEPEATSDASQPGSSEGSRPEGAGVEVALPADAPEGASAGRYQFVETPTGMSVEAVSGDQVQTLSCPSRSCAGLCDECAVAACRSAGELDSVCTALLSRCESSCRCENGGGDFNCGFPVCTTDRWVCYLAPQGPDALDPLDPAIDPTPDPEPDPAPASDPFAGQPSSSGSSSGSGASTPAPS